jgi:poly(3-hydroxybutyrate) depolymerase
MKSIVISIFLVTTLVSFVSHADFIAVEGSLETPMTRDHYVTLPEGFDVNRIKGYPLLINYHGRGGRGSSFSDLENVLEAYNPATMGSNGDWDEALPFVVVSPQTSGSWNANAQLGHPGIINHALQNYNIDPNHVYFTGLSLGGNGTWHAINRTGSEIAAAIPVAGWGGINVDNCPDGEHIAVWAFHGEADNEIAFNRGMGAVNSMNNRCNPTYPAKMTSFPGVGHNSWTRTYKNQHGDTHVGGDGIVYDDIYWWLLSFGLDGNPYIDPEFPNPFDDDANNAPVADAGADQEITLPDNILTLNGSGTDSDGVIESYLWEQNSGPTVSMFGADTSQLLLEDLLEGHYQFSLTVTDNEGATDTDSVNVSVLAEVSVNILPVANAGADQEITLPINSTILSGSGTDEDGVIVSYLWEKLNGPAASLTGENTEQLSISDLEVGNYNFRLTVEDNEGGTDSDDVSVTVLPEASTTLDLIKIDFGAPASSDLDVNLVNTLNTDFALNTVSGLDTGITAHVTGFTGTNQSGATSTDVPEGITAQMSRDSFYGNDVRFSGQINPKGTLVLSGLDPNALYDLSIYSSRMGVGDNRQTHYEVNGLNTADLYLDVHNNITSIVTAESFQSDANGEIIIEIEKGLNNTNSYGFFYLGSMLIQKLEPQDIEVPIISLLVNNPYILELGEPLPAKELLIQAIDDVDGDITSLVQETGRSDVDINQAGSYFITFNVSDAAGNIADEVTLVVEIEEPAPLDLIKIDFGAPASSDLDVNLVNTLNTDFVLNTVSGLDSGITAHVTGFTGTNQSGTTSTDVPEGITAQMSRDSFYGNDVRFSGQINPQGMLILSGLDPNVLYDLSIYSSRMGVGDNRETHYQMNGLNTEDLYLNVHNNITSIVTAESFQADANGEIIIEIKKGPNNTNSYGFFYLGSVLIEKQ